IKSTGSYAGWGFQLQSPVFVAALAVLFVALALNFFGVYEFRAPFVQKTQGLVSHRGLWGAFLNGVLATVVATPCTAPFMGAALGFALLEPPVISFSIFTALALGMALPVLVLSLHPEFLRFIPKPGPWIDKLKKGLGLLLLATAVWLAWVFSLQMGWGSGPSQKDPEALIAWEVYSDERFEELKKDGRIVFIDFTAAWCLTCQVNERIALDVPKTANAFRAMNVAPLKADWTTHDEKVSRALGRYGRSSIPFYVFHDFRKGEGAPVILPEILAPVTLLEALEKMGYNPKEAQGRS
ncbi:MAG TPA: thioredoxin family protein, partial [Candidatus Omnitrophota bacterium]|nr:thioredoxin family protein [Candidatus Omnitrophota bacterium]